MIGTPWGGHFHSPCGARTENRHIKTSILKILQLTLQKANRDRRIHHIDRRDRSEFTLMFVWSGISCARLVACAPLARYFGRGAAFSHGLRTLME